MKTLKVQKTQERVGKLLLERLNGLREKTFSLSPKELREAFGKNEDEFDYEKTKKTLKRIFPKIEEEKEVEIFFEEGKNKEKRMLFFKITCLGEKEFEIKENTEPIENIEQPTMKKEEKTTEKEHSWEEKAGVLGVYNLYKFPGLKKGEVQRLLYALHKICKDDSGLYYRELKKAKKNNRMPEFLKETISSLNEEHRILVSEYGQEHRVGLFVFGTDQQALFFNRMMEDDENEYEKQILNIVGDESILMGITDEALRFYMRIVKKLEKRVPGTARNGEGDLFEKIVKILEEKA